MNNNKIATRLLVYLGMITFCLAVWTGVIWVAGHFIGKWW